MKAVFLSDAHLRCEDDESYRALVLFLDSLKDHINDLFIVGDLFDFWFCRDSQIYPGFRSVIEELVDLQKKGVRISLFEGNHDFFLEDYFTRTHDITVFTEWAHIELDGRKLLVSHGDTVDKTNKKYLLLRKLLRSALLYKIQRVIPTFILWEIAQMSSTVSKELTYEPETVIANKMEAFALEKFQEGFDAVILGHCHIPILKEFEINGRAKTFATLGDWIRYHSYLYYEDGRFILSTYEHKKVNSE